MTEAVRSANGGRTFEENGKDIVQIGDLVDRAQLVLGEILLSEVGLALRVMFLLLFLFFLVNLV